MDVHPWTKYDVARARDEERLLRAMATYRSLRGADGGALDPAVESSAHIRLLHRMLRREVGKRAPASSIAKGEA
jgi:hypothetical protein